MMSMFDADAAFRKLTGRGIRLLMVMAVVFVAFALVAPQPASVASTQVMWRLYNPNTGEHFYTANTNERDHLVSLGWKYDGIAWYACGLGVYDSDQITTGGGTSTGGATSGPSAEAYYIVNKNSKVFHRPECPSATRMNASNRLTFTGTRDQAVAQGYKPCSNCRP